MFSCLLSQLWGGSAQNHFQFHTGWKRGAWGCRFQIQEDKFYANTKVDNGCHSRATQKCRMSPWHSLAAGRITSLQIFSVTWSVAAEYVRIRPTTSVFSLLNCVRGCVGHARVALGFACWSSHPPLFSLIHPLLFYSVHIKGPQTTAQALKG